MSVPLTLRVFLSSPGDVAEERKRARQVIEALANSHLLRGRVHLETVGWDDEHASAPLDARETPQVSVNRYTGRPSECDLTVVILWSRIGTHLPPDLLRANGSRYESGTIWEYEDALAGDKPVFIYRRSTKPQIDLDDLQIDTKRAQYAAVNAFFERLSHRDGSLRVGFHTYAQPQDFERLLRQHLEGFINEQLLNTLPETTPPIRSEDPAQPLVTNQPFSTARPTLPSRLVAGTIGRLLYWLTADARQMLRQRILQGGALETRLFPGISIPYKQRTGVHALSLGQITLITGPAGVGKTTYLDHLLPHLSPTVDLPIILRGAKIADSGAPSAHDVCREICEFFASTGPLGRYSMVPLQSVAFALSNKKVLLVLEDLHHAGSASDVLLALRSYLSARHRWGQHVRILATTREPAEQIRQGLRDEVTIVPLMPFSQAEAQEFFVELWQHNKLPSDAIVRNGDALAHAFGTDAIRTPLFIALCAWLASPVIDSDDLGKVLSMTAAEVFDTFILQLYQRSNNPGLDYGRFRDVYERIALSFWPEWEDCRYEQLQTRLQALCKNVGALSVEFLQRNGFLFASRFQGLRLRFPHHAMADYLTACSMVKYEQYHILGRETIAGRVEGLVPFLRELLTEEQAFARLSETNFPVFLGVVERELDGGGGIPPQQIVRSLYAYARRREEEGYLSTAYRRVHALVHGRIGDRWVRDFVALLKELPPGVGTIEAAVETGQGYLEEIFLSWLKDESARIAIKAAGVEPSVQRSLAKAICTGSREVFRHLAPILLSQTPLTATDELKQWLRRVLSSIDSDQFKMLIKSASGPALLADALRDVPLHEQQRSVSIIVAATGQALIPCGVYEIVEDRKPTRVRINQAFLVPALATRLNGPLGSVREVQQQLSLDLGTNSIKSSIMSRRQAEVVHTHFRFSPFQHGVIFADVNSNMDEILRIGPEQIDLFRVVMPSAGTAVQTMAGMSKNTAELGPVQYRIIRTIANI